MSVRWYQSTKRRPFISVYPGLYGDYVAAYDRRQREGRESRIEYSTGNRPAYRINIRFKGEGA